MYEIDTLGNLNGRFENSNPQTARIATRMDANWLNMVQDELKSVLVLAGIAPSKLVNSQLRDAIVAIVTGAVGTGGGAVPTTRQVNGAGLASGGGPLAGDLTITVAKALSAAIRTGTNDSDAITPLQLATAIGDGASTPLRLPGGSMLMWGDVFCSANTFTNITLPTSFASQCYFADVVGGNVTNGTSENTWVTSRGTSTLTVYNADNVSSTFNWIAWGK